MHPLREEVHRLSRHHHDLMVRCLPLEAGENITSPSVRLALTSDYGHRYAGARWTTACYESYTQIEQKVKDTFCRVYGAGFAELRVLSGMVANWISFLALTQPGDRIMGLRAAHGGHRTVQESSLAGARGLEYHPIPFDGETMRIDLDATVAQIEEVRPRIVMVGANIFLFPYPLAELVEATRRCGGILVYDAAMVLGLIAGGAFQNPLAAGAGVLTASTHKTFPGPQGGIVLGDSELEERIVHARRTSFSNFHPQRIVSLAMALTEIDTFGEAYAAQTVANAKALAASLHAGGLPVLCEEVGFTETHQVIVDCASIGGAAGATQRLSEANIISSPHPIPRDDGTDEVSGLILGTAEVTRLGMGEVDMAQVAQRISDVVLGRRSPKDVKREVEQLRESFQEIHYSFDEGQGAYAYFGEWKPQR
ncbi:MAG: beta-eliminating lyase-related protein [Candidatus Latescibacteria bacterium]|nr:beta-eliminating lyase-related protein [Candidatus Latescibacterota bacterium]